ncbi:MAG: phage recombination protein Bet [Deinococcus sp.]|nr:phage recombination protein Bet [Deinococcus sp.]
MTALEMRPAQPPVAAQGWTEEQVDLIKKTVAAGTTDTELSLFLEVAKSSGLNPFQRQIYAVKRKSGREEKMTIQTGIDGYRLIASRSAAHLGTTDAEFGPTNKDGYPEWARVTARRLVQGHIAEFTATARWSEYVQTKDEWQNGQRTGKKIVGDMWAKMPHTMLGKCAEALALRKAFPAELSGVYTAEEMAQADSAEPLKEVPAGRSADITQEVKAQVAQEARPEQAGVMEQWATKLGTVGAKIRNRYPAAKPELDGIFAARKWRESVDAAQETYAELTALGKRLHAEEEAAKQAEPEVIDAEVIPDFDPHEGRAQQQPPF